MPIAERSMLTLTGLDRQSVAPARTSARVEAMVGYALTTMTPVLGALTLAQSIKSSADPPSKRRSVTTHCGDRALTMLIAPTKSAACHTLQPRFERPSHTRIAERAGSATRIVWRVLLRSVVSLVGIPSRRAATSLSIEVCAMLVGIHGFAYGNTSATRIEGVSKSTVLAPLVARVNDASHALPTRIGAALGMYQNATPVWIVLSLNGLSGDSGVA